VITPLLNVGATYILVLFFAHIQFMLNRTFKAVPAERLQHCIALHACCRLPTVIATLGPDMG